MNYRNKMILGLFLAAAFIVFPKSGFAQSQDIDSLTALKSRVLTGNLVANSNSEYFYSFFAGPGSFTVTIDVKTSNYNSTLDATFISDANRGTGLVASAVHKGSDRQSKTLNVAKKKKIIMKLKDFSSSDGTFKITLSGAVALPE